MKAASKPARRTTIIQILFRRADAAANKEVSRCGGRGEGLASAAWAAPAADLTTAHLQAAEDQGRATDKPTGQYRHANSPDQHQQHAGRRRRAVTVRRSRHLKRCPTAALGMDGDVFHGIEDSTHGLIGSLDRRREKSTTGRLSPARAIHMSSPAMDLRSDAETLPMPAPWLAGSII